jgi:hypothetical protein
VAAPDLKHSSMKDTKLKVVALMFAAPSIFGTDYAFAATPAMSRVRYVCEPRQSLVVTRFGDIATVEFIDRSYELRRTASSIGERYVADDAALIIDGKSVVFVAEDRLQLGTCVEGMSLTSE